MAYLLENVEKGKAKKAEQEERSVRGRTPQIRRILRRKRIKRAIKAYGNYIAAAVLVAVVFVAVVGAAVKPAANTVPEKQAEPEPTAEATEEPQREQYPFNLMSLDWSGEELEGWTRYEAPEDYAEHGGYFPECMQQFT